MIEADDYSAEDRLSSQNKGRYLDQKDIRDHNWSAYNRNTKSLFCMVCTEVHKGKCQLSPFIYNEKDPTGFKNWKKITKLVTMKKVNCTAMLLMRKNTFRS